LLGPVQFWRLRLIVVICASPLRRKAGAVVIIARARAVVRELDMTARCAAAIALAIEVSLGLAIFVRRVAQFPDVGCAPRPTETEPQRKLHFKPIFRLQLLAQSGWLLHHEGH